MTTTIDIQYPEIADVDRIVKILREQKDYKIAVKKSNPATGDIDLIIGDISSSININMERTAIEVSSGVKRNSPVLFILLCVIAAAIKNFAPLFINIDIPYWAIGIFIFGTLGAIELFRYQQWQYAIEQTQNYLVDLIKRHDLPVGEQPPAPATPEPKTNSIKTSAPVRKQPIKMNRSTTRAWSDTQQEKQKNNFNAQMIGLTALAVAILGGAVLYATGVFSPKAETNTSRATPTTYIESSQAVRAVKAEEKRGQIHATRRNYLAIDHSGDNMTTASHQLVKTERGTNHTELYIETDVFPTRSFDLEQLIPADISTEQEGQDHDFMFVFANPDFPGIQYRHRLEGVRRLHSRQHQGDSYLFTKSFPSKSTPIKGRVTTQSTAGELLYSQTFTVAYDKEQKAFIAQFEDGSAPMMLTEAFIDEVGVMPDDSKASILIRSVYRCLRLIKRVQLKEKGVYTVDRVYLPPLMTGLSEADQKQGPIYVDGYLKNYWTSREDNVAYCSIYGDGYEIRYFIPYSKGKVEGMHLVSTSPSGEVVQLIEVFRQAE